MTRAAAAIALSTAALLLSLAPCAEGYILPGTWVEGHIQADTTWTLAGSPYVVYGDLFVDKNVNLTIEQGVAVKFKKGTALYVDGGLMAQGVLGSGITFISYESKPTLSDWRGLQVNSTGSAYLAHVTFSHAENGLMVCGGELRAEHCTFTMNFYQAIYCGAESNVEVRDSTISSSEHDGVLCDNRSYARIEGCSIRGHRYGLILYGEGNVTACTIEMNGVGLLCWNTTSYIADNRIMDCLDGLYVFSSSPLVCGNTISGCEGNGTRFYNSSAAFVSNDLFSNGAGIDIPYCSREVIKRMKGNYVNGIALEDLYFYANNNTRVSGLSIDSGWSAHYIGNITSQGGLTFYDCTNLVLSNVTVRHNWWGLYFVNSAVRVENSTIAGVVEGAMRLDEGSQVKTVNLSYEGAVVIADQASTLEEMDYLQVHVRNETLVPIEGAKVSIYEEGVHIFELETDSDGNTPWALVMSSFVSETGRMEPYITANVSFGSMAFNDNPRTLRVTKRTRLVFTDLGDIWHPEVLDASVLNGGTKIGCMDPITIYFSEPMDRESVEAAFTISPPLPYHLVWEGWNLTFVPDAPMNYSTRYTITIDTGAADLRGNALPNPYALSFTIEESPEVRRTEELIMYGVVGFAAVLGVVALLILLRKRQS
ncbi:MAG: right-handed parallel beta-helix repeat-containing protein [Candidatus Thermoplasmatota archaeon]